MRKRRIYVVLLIIAVAGVVGLVVAGAFREREPEYEGKRLSEWVEQYNAKLDAESDEAIRRIGTNAIPCLLEWIGYETPGWKSALAKRLNPILRNLKPSWEIPYDKERRASLSAVAFRALGSDGKPAFAELCRLIHDRSESEAAGRAISALGFLGKDALQPLMDGLTNKQARTRVSAVSALSSLTTNARPAVPLLIGSLNDTNEFVAARAAMVLGELRLEPDVVIPALSKSLQDPRSTVRRYAAKGLAAFGQEAEQALPALANHLGDSDRQMRNAVTNAIFKIDPHALERAGK